MFKNSVLENVSFITTVFNEAGSIKQLLDSLIIQELLPSEIIIVDGGSNDGAISVIIDFFKNKCISFNEYGFEIPARPAGIKSIKTSQVISEKLIFEGVIQEDIRVKIYLADGASISQGRNIAIKSSNGVYICVSDGGCILSKNWIRQITAYYFQNENRKIDHVRNSVGARDDDISYVEKEPKKFIIGGHNMPLVNTFFKLCLSACFMPRINEIKAESFKPSSRNISFSRSAWLDAGRYPENMDFGEDMKFNFNILNAGYEIKFNPEAEVYWDMRDSLTAVFKQFFRYAKGDAIGKMYPRRHLIRILSLLLFLGILIVSIVFSPFFLLALLPLLAFYIYKPYCRIYYYLNNKNKYIFNKNRLNRIISFLGSMLVIPLIMIIIDIAKLFGYTYGLFAENRH